MKFDRKYSLSEIAELLNCAFEGNPEFEVSGMNEIHVVEPGDIVFVDHPKYYDKALESDASVVLINKKVQFPPEKALLISDDPFTDFNKLTRYFSPFKKLEQNFPSTSSIGKNTILQPNVIIGNNVKIGDNCIIHSNVVLYDNTEIGNNVVIHAGTVIGADAFYYKNRPEHFDQLLSGGNVCIEDDVHIGALCSIDKGVTGTTRVKKGTKIDNQVQIGHDTVIGKKCLIAAQVGIAGCVILEDEVTLWGQVGLASGITIGKKAVLLAQSGVSKSLPGYKAYFGYPAEEAKKKYKELAAIRNIPKLFEYLKPE